MKHIPTIKELMAAGWSRATAFRRRKKLLAGGTEPERVLPRNGLVYLPESHAISSESHERDLFQVLRREIDDLSSRVAALEAGQVKKPEPVDAVPEPEQPVFQKRRTPNEMLLAAAEMARRLKLKPPRPKEPKVSGSWMIEPSGPPEFGSPEEVAAWREFWATPGDHTEGDDADDGATA